jgi:hypothetical protein
MFKCSVCGNKSVFEGAIMRCEKNHADALVVGACQHEEYEYKMSVNDHEDVFITRKCKACPFTDVRMGDTWDVPQDMLAYLFGKLPL